MQETKVTRQDIKFWPSERLTDNPDGGGQPIGTPLTGADNELFNPISSIARINGAFYTRLVYAGIMRSDAEMLIGSFAAITKPPSDPSTSYLLFKATKFGEQREEILKRIEAFAVRTIESRMTLMSTQSSGSRVIQAYQRPGEPLPLVGDVYCLHQDTKGYPQHEQYIQVIKVESEDRTFYNPETKKDFVRTVVKMEISQRLDHDFIGADYPVEGYVEAPCLVRETHITDSAQYYGIKPLVAAIRAGDMNVKIPDLMEKLVPTNQIETQLVDLTAAGQRPLLFDSAKKGTDGVISITVSKTITADTVYHIGNAVMPDTVVLSMSAGEAKDDGGTLKINDESVGTIDYARGEIRLSSSGSIYTIKYRPAATELKVADTAAISVTQQNRSYNYLMTINPPPATGSLVVSYRSQGRWYDLRDDGSGKLRGGSAGHGSGNVNFVSGTVSITCGELPDVSSEILYAWGTRANYTNRAGISTKAKMVMTLKQPPAPNTVKLEWENSGTKHASDDGSGNITGDWTGKIDYANRKIIIDTGAGFSHPEGVLDVKITYNSGEPLTKSFKAPIRGSEGKVTLDLEQKNIKPRTFRQRWNLLIEDYDISVQEGDGFWRGLVDPYKTITDDGDGFWRGLVDPYKTITDDGNGNLVDVEGNNYGTIDYSAGTVKFNPDTTVKIPKSKYRKEPMGQSVYHSAILKADYVTQLYRNIFDGYEYVPAGASMPIDDTALVETWFRTDQSPDAVEEHLNSGTIEIDLSAQYAERVVPNSVNFTWGDKNYFDRRGELYCDLDRVTGAAEHAGSIDYNTGVARLKKWTYTDGAAPDVLSLATSIDGNPVDEAVFRAPSSPLRPQSLQIVATKASGGQIDVRANAKGEITSDNTDGYVDYETGVIRVRFGKLVTAAGNESEEWYNADAVDDDGKIWKPEHVFAKTITYSTVAYSYLPVDSSIVKIDTVRLPSDGRVPIFRRGDTILINNAASDDLGSAHTQGATVNLSRDDVDRICLVDADDKPINAELWDYDLAAGTITWASPLDLSSYRMPITAKHAREERNRVLVVDIDGTLTLQFPLKRDYPLEGTYVSSILIGGDLQVRHSVPFTQRNWDRVWRDEPEGEQLLNKLNLKDYPMVLTDDGAITDRWLIKFTAPNQFELYSESLGFVKRADTLQDLAPINPATNKPYFTIPKQAFGNDAPWATQDVIRFNTWGTLIPIWVLCAQQPTSEPQTGTDGFTQCLYGDTTEL